MCQNECYCEFFQDPILGITEAYLANKAPNKINLGVVRSLCIFKGIAPNRAPCLPYRYGVSTLLTALHDCLVRICMSWAQGAYRDDEGKPVVLDVVRDAESRISGVNFME